MSMVMMRAWLTTKVARTEAVEAGKKPQSDGEQAPVIVAASRREPGGGKAGKRTKTAR